MLAIVTIVIIMYSMNEFCIHWIIFYKINTSLALENPDGNSVEH